MTYDHHPRTPEEIEAEIERDRSALNRTISSLQDRVSLDGALHTVSESGAELGDAVVSTVRRNPAAVALIGAGLAWLAYSSTRSSGPARNEPTYPVPATAPQYNRQFAEPGPLPAYDAGAADSGDSPWDKARRNIDDARRKARGRFDDASAEARERFESARSSVQAQAQSLGTSARHLRDRIQDGTSEMSEGARRRVIAARTRAYEAQVKAEYLARRGQQKATGFFQEQPLVAGALALAAGAALGSALPRTQRENAAFGAYRDELFDEAERIYREERAALRDVARDTADAAKEEAGGLLDDAKGSAKAAESAVEARAKSVADTARKSAKENGLADSAKR
ncbi:MAG: DUF3618 domain-containing protein [Pseudooceanicola sp.]